LAAFQAVQFQLPEAEAERAGVDMLARYALWSYATERAEAHQLALTAGHDLAMIEGGVSVDVAQGGERSIGEDEVAAALRERTTDRPCNR
jgi:hypothetical protein